MQFWNSICEIRLEFTPSIARQEATSDSLLRCLHVESVSLANYVFSIRELIVQVKSSTDLGSWSQFRSTGPMTTTTQEDDPPVRPPTYIFLSCARDGHANMPTLRFVFFPLAGRALILAFPFWSAKPIQRLTLFSPRPQPMSMTQPNLAPS